MKIRQGGFTLLEIMVAFTLMAVSLAVLLQAFGGSVRLIGDAGEVSKAVSLAQSQLAELGQSIDLVEGEQAGDWQQGYRWRMTIEPFEPLQAVSENPLIQLYRVEVTIFWEQGGRERHYQLSTLRLARKERL